MGPGYERRLYDHIAVMFGERQDLLTWLFDAVEPKMRCPAEAILRKARGFSSGEQVLIKLAVDLWCEEGGARVSELSQLDPNQLLRVLKVLGSLYAS